MLQNLINVYFNLFRNCLLIYITFFSLHITNKTTVNILVHVYCHFMYKILNITCKKSRYIGKRSWSLEPYKFFFQLQWYHLQFLSHFAQVEPQFIINKLMVIIISSNDCEDGIKYIKSMYKTENNVPGLTARGFVHLWDYPLGQLSSLLWSKAIHSNSPQKEH